MKIIFSILMTALVTAAVVPLAPSNSRTLQTPRVVVIDVPRCINACKQKAEAEAEIDRWQAGVQAELDQQAKELEQKQMELETFRPGTEKYNDMLTELKVGEFSLKTRLERLNEELANRRSEAIVVAFQAVERVCAQMISERGYDLVLQIDGKPVGTGPREVLPAEIVARTVVGVRPELDITEDVISILRS